MSNNMMSPEYYRPAKDAQERIDAFRKLNKKFGVCYESDDILKYLKDVFDKFKQAPVPKDCHWAVGHHFTSEKDGSFGFIVSPVLVDSNGTIYDYTDPQYGQYFDVTNPDFYYDEGQKWP